MFDTSLNTGLRFALRAFKSSSIESLRNLASELLPDLRRTYNTLLYTARSLINIENSSNKYLAKNIKKAEEYEMSYHIDFLLTPSKNKTPEVLSMENVL
jgi:hypothetical protein